MRARQQKSMIEKEVPLLEQKGYKRPINELIPVQQGETYRNPTKKVIKEAVQELNPDKNSMNFRG